MLLFAQPLKEILQVGRIRNIFPYFSRMSYFCLCQTYNLASHLETGPSLAEGLELSGVLARGSNNLGKEKKGRAGKSSKYFSCGTKKDKKSAKYKPLKSTFQIYRSLGMGSEIDPSSYCD